MDNINKVSVIIPIYGVEKYIERCARSLFQQTMKTGIEFIFVNDATLDNSMEILGKVISEFPERKDQIKIINHKENRGLAAVRKTGIKSASGEYVIHCDSDDWVEPNMYELMYVEAKRVNADIVGCDIYEEYSDRTSLLKQEFNLPPHEQAVIVMNVGSRRIERYLWNRLIRKETYFKLGFDNPNINLWEDVSITIPLHIISSRIGYVNKPLYHYNRANVNSLVSSFNEDKLAQLITVSEYLNKYVMILPNYKEYKPYMDNRLLSAKLYYLTHKLVYNPKKWRKLWPNLDISNYPSRPMRFLMRCASYHLDFIVKGAQMFLNLN